MSPAGSARLGRPLLIWLCSFVLAASVLLIYVHVPVGPLIVAGGGTLALTLVRSFLN